jgi:3-oxoacyl-[acyl-carrier-protein] synthase-1
VRALAVVTTAGARTALGRTATQTGFLLRTGMPAITASSLVDTAGEAVTMCFDPTLPPLASAPERAAELGVAALTEALAPLAGGARSLRARLVLCVDEPRRTGAGAPADPARDQQTKLAAERVVASARAAVGELSVEVVARGAAGAAVALPDALAALGAGAADVVLLGGMHSDHDPREVAALEAAGRLFSPDNLDALVPGEAAAFVVLAREDVARRAHLVPGARLYALGHGLESARPDNDDSAYRARGLTDAVRAATAQLDGEQKVGWGLCDHTFETQRLREWQAMMTRTRHAWGEPLLVDSPAQRLGHLGAAALPLFAVLAAEGFRRGYAPAPLVLAFAGSDGGTRGALLMGAP